MGGGRSIGQETTDPEKKKGGRQKIAVDVGKKGVAAQKGESGVQLLPFERERGGDRRSRLHSLEGELIKKTTR